MDLQEELAVAIADTNGQQEAVPKAQLMLDNFCGGSRAMIGIEPNEEAVILDDGMHIIERVDLSGDDHIHLHAVRKESVSTLREIERRVRDREWQWIHPRFRWLDVGDSHDDCADDSRSG